MLKLILDDFRLLHVCISRDDTCAALWIAAIKEMLHVLPSVLFILQSSTNGEKEKMSVFISALTVRHTYFGCTYLFLT